MRKRIISTLVCVVAVSLAGAASTDPPTMSLVGFTTAKNKGDVGLFVLHDACSAEFGYARLCTLKEAIETIHPPELSGDDGWLQNVASPLDSCRGWLSASGNSDAETMDTYGGIRRRPCNIERPAACCSPHPKRGK